MFQNNEEFMSRWCVILNKYSLDLIILIIDITHKKIQDLKVATDREMVSCRDTEGEFDQQLSKEEIDLKQFNAILKKQNRL